MGTALLPLRLRKRAFIFARLFSSSAALVGRNPADYDISDGESPVYRRALRIQRPISVRYQENLHNFVSLIGAIDKPLKAFNSEKFGFYTFLRVRASAPANRGFEIMVQFWDKMAEVSSQHLKLDDVVYVSGHLRSYLKLDEEGNSLHYYKVDVKEMNLVAQNTPEPSGPYPVKLEPEVPFEDRMQRRRDRLHLWQIFFANPSEWWDNRNSKRKPGTPDFKHKDTGEALWIQEDDPPWINEQLRLRDSRSSKRSHERQRDGWARLSPLVFDEGKSN